MWISPVGGGPTAPRWLAELNVAEGPQEDQTLAKSRVEGIASRHVATDKRHRRWQGGPMPHMIHPTTWR